MVRFNTKFVIGTCYLLLILAAGSGCACLSDNIPGFENVVPPKNPMLITSAEHPDVVWERIVDAVDDYFDVEREEPIRSYTNLLTEGRIDTYPKIGATYLEPWLHDSVTPKERLVSTNQTIRRRATVRVVPELGGYNIYVSVYKELEDLHRPLGANTGSANFTYTNSINTISSLSNEAPVSYGWISQGRDMALEQRILLKILYNIQNPPAQLN